jgi:flagellar protein FliS
MTTTAAFAAARTTYTRNSIDTASPDRLLVMLYDRLLRDLSNAETAISERALERANAELQHAQQIVLELRTSLDVDAWSGGPGLAQLYTYLHGELVAANTEKNAERVSTCRQIVEPLRNAWQQAASGVLTS